MEKFDVLSKIESRFNACFKRLGFEYVGVRTTHNQRWVWKRQGSITSTSSGKDYPIYAEIAFVETFEEEPCVYFKFDSSQAKYGAEYAEEWKLVSLRSYYLGDLEKVHLVLLGKELEKSLSLYG